MSGSSLDGLDIAFCTFQLNEKKELTYWNLEQAETFSFSEKWQSRLLHLPNQDAMAFAQTHTYFGHYMGEMVNKFIDKYKINPDFIAVHGHTIYHYPDKRMTIQIGDGAALSAVTGYPVINNFRTQDIALDGEGTPLAPIADQYLLSEYDFFLNLGGIANVTAKTDDHYVAFDIGPANQILNILANQLDLEYDKNGAIAATGKMIPELKNTIDELPYFQQEYPKSLDNQWISKHVVTFYLDNENTVEDKLHTACWQLADQITKSVQHILKKEKMNRPGYRMIVSGGGAMNGFLMQCIKEACKIIPTLKVEIPDQNLVFFKEAILMALMGVLRVENIPNCLSTVTGAKRDTIGGGIFQGWRKKI